MLIEIYFTPNMLIFKAFIQYIYAAKINSLAEIF